MEATRATIAIAVDMVPHMPDRLPPCSPVVIYCGKCRFYKLDLSDQGLGTSRFNSLMITEIVRVRIKVSEIQLIDGYAQQACVWAGYHG